MTQNYNEEFQRYSYDSFDTPRLRSRIIDTTERPSPFAFLARFRHPGFAAGALLTVAAVFGAVIYMSYPQENAPEDVPVVTAQAGPLRTAPDQAGGMEIPNQDSAVLAAMSGETLPEKPPVENLLSQEKPVDTASLFAQQVQKQMSTTEQLEKVAAGQPASEPKPAAAVQTAEAPKTQTKPAPPSLESLPIAEPAPIALNLPTAKAAMKAQKQSEEAAPGVKIVTMETVKIPPKIAAAAKPEAPKFEAPAAVATAPSTSASPEMHAAGAAPKTLDYVRTALDKTPPQPAAPQAIEPAAGAAQPARTVETGSFYIQLASIADESAAPREWNKLQSALPTLAGLNYRVQRADLGPKGVFFRIQAGPMSQASASSLCVTIKTQKPGGCLIVH